MSVTGRLGIHTYRIVIVSYHIIVSPHSIFFPSPSGVLGAVQSTSKPRNPPAFKTRACLPALVFRACVRAANFIAKTCVCASFVAYRVVRASSGPPRPTTERFWTFAPKGG
jgi:hypothetical protein